MQVHACHLFMLLGTVLQRRCFALPAVNHKTYTFSSRVASLGRAVLEGPLSVKSHPRKRSFRALPTQWLMLQRSNTKRRKAQNLGEIR